MPARGKGKGGLREPVATRALMERQGHRYIGSLEQLLTLSQEPVDQPGKARRGGVKSGADGISSHLLQLTGNNGGEQGMRQTCKFRLGEISVLPTTLNHAYPEPPRQRGLLLP